MGEHNQQTKTTEQDTEEGKQLHDVNKKTQIMKF